MLCFIIKSMVVRNQEAQDTLETYLKTFNLTAFPGENVPIAYLRLKAIARALGNNYLPKNIVQTILEGFSKTSMDNRSVSSSQLSLSTSTEEP